MWRWQQSVPKRYQLGIKILAISAVLHLCLLFCLLFMYRGYYSALAIEVGKKIPADARVIFLPFQKVAPRTMQRAQTSAAAERKAEHVESVERKTVEPEVKKEEKKSEPLKTTLLIDKPKVLPKKKKVAAKNKQKLAQKKTSKKAAQKIVQQKPIVEKKVPVIQTVEKVQAPEQIVGNAAAGTEENVVYVGTSEIDALMMQDQIQSEIEQCWRPPTGLAPDLICQVQVVIDWQGGVHAMKTIATSGVLLFDMSAQEAIRTLSFPKMAWGKDITITFNEGRS